MLISNECLLFAPRMGRLSATIICYWYYKNFSRKNNEKKGCHQHSL
jgi:hypothetical protein